MCKRRLQRRGERGANAGIRRVRTALPRRLLGVLLAGFGGLFAAGAQRALPEGEGILRVPGRTETQTHTYLGEPLVTSR